MNEYYKKRAAVPRKAKTADTIQESLKFWREERLLSVVSACEGDEDSYRVEYSELHSKYASTVQNILSSDDFENGLKNMQDGIYKDFEMAISGAQKDAAGLCGAELNGILSLHIQEAEKATELSDEQLETVAGGMGREVYEVFKANLINETGEDNG